MKKPSRRAIARQVMLGNQNLSLIQTLAEMRKRGVKTTRGTLITWRHEFRKEGLNLPYWATLSKQNRGIIIRLGSAKEKMMREIYENPRLTSGEHQRRLAERGVKRSIVQIKSLGTKMRRWFPEIDFSRKPKPIVLTKAQKAMIPEFTRLVKDQIHYENRSRVDWTTQTKREFIAFVLPEIPRLVSRYNRTRANPKTFIENAIPWLRKQFIRESLMSGMGIKREEADLIMSILREKHQGNKDHGKIARNLGCKKKEVDRLLETYQTYQRIEGRTGKREEQ